jgi:hypothetical protein
MKLIRIVAVVALILSAIPVRAQLFEEKSKKQAKELFEKAMREGNDRVNQVHDLCQAASLQPRERKYADACSSYTAGLNHDDTASLASAILAYQSHDLEKAESLARQVSNFDPKLFAKAKLVLDAIHSDKSAGQSVEQVKAAWEKGDFNAVQSLAQGMTTPAAKNAAGIYVKNVEMYNQFIEDAEKEKEANPDGAKDLLGRAYMLNQNGPSDPRGKINDINNALAAKSNSKYFGSQPNGSKSNGSAGTAAKTDAGTKDAGNKVATANGTAPNPADFAKKVNALLAEARNAEKQSNSAVAIGDYAAVLKLQPDNKEAQGSSARLEQAIKSDPAAATNELKSAIRSFYNAQFDDARTALMEYLESPQTAQNLGAADFYLGATLIQRSILRTPRSQWKGPSADALSAFKAARKANYSPVRAYVSPALLKVWDSTGQ